MKTLGVLIAAAAVVCVSSDPYSSYYDSYSKPSSSYGYGSSSKYYDDYYSKPSSSYGYGSSSKYYDDYYSKPSSSYGYGSSSKYYDDYYSKPSSSYGYGSSSKYDSYSKPSSSYGYGSSSKYYDDYYSKPSSSYGSSSSSKYYDDYYSKPSSSYGSGSSSKYYDDYYSKPSSSYGSGSSSKYYDDYYSKPSSSYGSGSSSDYYDDYYNNPSSSYGSDSTSKYDEEYYEEPEEDNEESGESLSSSEGEGGSGNSTCNCGWVNKGRIVGGQEAKKNAYPFVVSLDVNGEQNCGATIVTERHIVTAAHCTFGRPLSSMQVRVGLHDLDKGQGTVHQIEKVIEHERYSSVFNDIALLVLKTPIKFDQNVGPVCLPSKQVNLDGQKIKALGWGNIWNKGPAPTSLLEVDLDVISYAQCDKAWENEFSQPVKGKNLCTYTDRKDTCQGDSGGPLVWLNPSTNRYTLVALVSYGGDCAGPLPAVNTDVAAYRSWINKKISGSGLSACTKG